MRHLAIFALALMASTNCAAAQSVDDLKKKLQEDVAQLNVVTTEITAAAGPEFNTSKNFEARLRTSVLAEWGATFSSPKYVISGDGVSADGTIMYQGGSYNVWPTLPWKAEIAFSQLVISAGESRLSAVSTAVATASANAGFSIGGVRGTQGCDLRSDQLPVAAQIDLNENPDGSTDYVMSLTSPTTMPAHAACQLDHTGIYWRRDVDLGNAARELSRGHLNLGYSKTIILTPPSPLPPVTLTLSATDSQIHISPTNVDVSANITISK